MSPPSILSVKFRDDLKARAVGGSVVSAVNSDLSVVLAVRTQFGLTFEPSTSLEQWQLDFLESRAAQMSGIAQPDLAGITVVTGLSETIEDAANALLAVTETEWVEFEPNEPSLTCADIPPQTPDLMRGGLGPLTYNYHAIDPGVGAFCAWAYGGRGEAVQVTTVEHGFRRSPDVNAPIHEDLCNVLTLNPIACLHNEDDAHNNHALAVLGILRAQENSYGWTGLAPDATVQFSSISEGCSSNVADGLFNAAFFSQPGDVISISLGVDVFPIDGRTVPLEVRLSYYTRIKNATDQGIIVVEGAGNGDPPTDLDSSIFLFWRQQPDSKAIIAGAGTPDKNHDRLYFSSYGQKVHVQAWGEHVTTLGYYDDFVGVTDPLQSYTTVFAGTSAAAPMVAGVAVAVQSLCLGHNLPLRTPLQMRQLLIDTGIPQGTATASQHIGPFVYLPKVILALGLATEDCNANGVPDDCDPQEDCNNNSIQDVCDIGAGTSEDCEDNLVPDECEALNDCNENDIQDVCEILADPFLDCLPLDGIPDDCEDTLGSCCFPDDSCHMTTSACCYFSFGFFTGYSQCYRFACSGFGPQP